MYKLPVSLSKWKTKKKKSTKYLGAGVALCSIFFGSSVIGEGGVKADTYIPLPGGHVSQHLINGMVVTVNLSREHALVSPPMVSVFTSRNVWTSGVFYASAPGASKVTLTAGYLVACQIRYNSGNYTWGNAGITFGTDSGMQYNLPSRMGDRGSVINSEQVSLDPGTNGGQLTISPGSTKFFSVLGDSSPSMDVPATGGGLSYSDVMFQQDECAGYASARAMATAQVTSGSETSSVTMWGKPFSIS